MTIDDEPLEPLDIDDRSPGERMIDAGRAGFGRIGELVEDQRFDVASLVWMLATVTFVGCDIYIAYKQGSGMQGFPGGSGWERIAFLGNTGGPVVAMSCLVGVALAALFDTPAARLAHWLAVFVGGWVVLAGIFELAASAHSPGDALDGGGSRPVGVLSGIAFAALGLVVIVIGLHFARPALAFDPDRP